MVGMQQHVLLFALVLASAVAVCHGFQAGASIVDATMPVGTPLAGLSERRWEGFPKAKNPPGKYTTLMKGSTGRIGGDINDGTYVRALVMDDGSTRIAVVTLDFIGAEGEVLEKAWAAAHAKGFTVPLDHCQFSASHSHSGPGAVSRHLLWQVAPAVDVLVPELEELTVQHIATAMLEAEKALQPAVLGFDNFITKAFTENRRAGKASPYVKPDDVDPNFGIARIDTPDGKPIATMWNLAMHGTCLGGHNLKFSGDIAGRTSLLVEKAVAGGVTMFINADAGDVRPQGGAAAMCSGGEDIQGSYKLRDFIVKNRETIKTSGTVQLAAHSHKHDFGDAKLNLTLERLQTHCEDIKDPMVEFLCLLGKASHFKLDPHIGNAWLACTPRFSAFRFTVDGEHIAMTSYPGEAIQELGGWIRDDVAKLGFKHHFFAGYSNEHMGYTTTPREYVAGGYESLLTFWGIDEAAKMRAEVLKAATAVKP